MSQRINETTNQRNKVTGRPAVVVVGGSSSLARWLVASLILEPEAQS